MEDMPGRTLNIIILEFKLAYNDVFIYHASKGLKEKKMKYLLGIDIGTSGTKTILIRETGEVIAKSFVEYPLLTPQPGWAEQDPESWYQATCETVRDVLDQVDIDTTDIAGIGLSGQMHGSVFLDEAGDVIRPALLWCDGRTDAECEEITKTVGAGKLHEYVSNPALTGFTLPKVLWLKNHEPENYSKVRQILLPKDYIRYRITGEYFMEVSDAAGTIMYDVKNRKWSEELLDELGIPLEWLPPVKESYDICGNITAHPLADCKLSTGTPVVGGGADNTCGAIGTGIISEGRVLLSLGTSGVIFAPTDSVKVDPEERLHTFCHSTPKQWYLMGCMLSAGMSLRWFRDQLVQVEHRNAEKSGKDIYDQLMAEAGEAPIGSEGLTFLPYLMGERSPHKDPYARGAFIGLSFRHTRGHMVRSIIEGVTYNLRHCLEIIKELGVPVNEIRAAGGGAKSKVWGQILADILGEEIVVPENTEGPAMGAALIAGVGTGVYKDFNEATERTVSISHRFSPNPESQKAYNDYYSLFRELYPTLKDSFHKGIKLVKGK